MNKEQIYDEKIAPLMDQIIAVAQEHGIAMIASFSIPNDENELLCCTTLLPDGDGKFSKAFGNACREIRGGNSMTVGIITKTQP